MHQSSVSRHGTVRIVTPGTGVAADSAEYGITIFGQDTSSAGGGDAAGRLSTHDGDDAAVFLLV